MKKNFFFSLLLIALMFLNLSCSGNGADGKTTDLTQVVVTSEVVSAKASARDASEDVVTSGKIAVIEDETGETVVASEVFALKGGAMEIPMWVPAGKEYVFQLNEMDDAGNIVYIRRTEPKKINPGELIKVQIGKDRITFTPANISVTPGDGRVIISWDMSDYADSCCIYVASKSGANKDDYSLVECRKNSPFTHAGLNNGKTYYYVLTASNSAGESKASSEFSATPDFPENTDDDGDGYSENQGDCNDYDKAVHPGAEEICGDGIDQDCDGNVPACNWYKDFDKDGYSDGTGQNSWSQPEGDYFKASDLKDISGDCDDGDAELNPGVRENCNDNKDNDCDGLSDCEDSDCNENSLCVCPDRDSDGYFAKDGCGTATDCNDNNAAIHPGATEIPGDGIDQNCDGVDPLNPYDTDDDYDGWTERNGDCNDNNAAVHPGTTEICGDSIDQDCDNIADDGCYKLLAHYKFEENADDSADYSDPMELKNTEFAADGALYLNGKYELAAEDTAGYRAVASISDLDYRSFTVGLDFNPTAFESSRENILTGGTLSPWFSLRYHNGSLELTLNNQEVVHTFGSVSLSTDTWHNVICSFDLANKKVVAMLDGKMLPEITLDDNFQLSIIGSEFEDSDRLFAFTNYSDADTFYGYADDLLVYSPALSKTELSQIAYFPDRKLRTAVREAIKKPVGFIMASDLLNLTYLYAYGKGIKDIRGLEYCTNLKGLYLGSHSVDGTLYGNSVSDLKPIENLTNLTGIDLSDNQLDDSDMVHLEKLKRLTSLNLNSNQISDISYLVSALAELTQLTFLYLGDNRISDISPLGNLIQLEGLYLHENQIADISPLRNLTQLSVLWLVDNEITDLSTLANLIQLTSLRINSNQISDINPLTNLTKLTLLSLSDNQISDISPLTNLIQLDILYLGYNQISDIGPLVDLNKLEHLGLESNRISDISSLSNLTQLTDLRLYVNQISDIKPLVDNSGINSGDTVALTGNPLNSTSCTVYIPELESRGVTVTHNCETTAEKVYFPDANLRDAIAETLGIAAGSDQDGSYFGESDLLKLTTLSADGKGIENISGLEYCRNLTGLYLGSRTVSDLRAIYKNSISDLKPIENLTNLTDLNLSGNQLDDSDLVYLENLTNLTWLGLGGNRISDISPLANLIQLITLYLDNNQISDITPLADLSKLEHLGVDYNQISDISPLANLIQLITLHLNGNQISDISPLLDNSGIGSGDEINLTGNPLNVVSCNSYIPQLKAREVTVVSDCKCTDGDGDGSFLEAYCGDVVDCDDSDDTIYPGADDIPGDGIDQNCDGTDPLRPTTTTTSTTTTTIRTTTTSTTSSTTTPTTTSTTSSTTTSTTTTTTSSSTTSTTASTTTSTTTTTLVTSDDCWWPGAACDSDHDGYSVNVTTGELDCNDKDATIHPGAEDISGDGIDQDCDGTDQ